jgi:hypothetical protein
LVVENMRIFDQPAVLRIGRPFAAVSRLKSGCNIPLVFTIDSLKRVADLSAAPAAGNFSRALKLCPPAGDD